MTVRRNHIVLLLLTAFAFGRHTANAQTKTWDGRYDTSQIKVTVAYFVPKDRKPLRDWRDRVEYYCGRIVDFHKREFQGMSEVRTEILPQPFVSKRTTEELRRGDADQIFFRTLQEVDIDSKFAAERGKEFPILLVLSDINHRPLDDFYRLTSMGGEVRFEGILNSGNHFPGSKLGGARATYIAQRGVGWGLVSADGWRVPYRGSDCVIYHEGLGHTVGLPHPEPPDPSVMSTAQYHGWISESWLKKEQKVRLGWKPVEIESEEQTRLFSEFRALPEPRQPRPGTPLRLRFSWPDDVTVKSLRVRFQTALDGPWIDVPCEVAGETPDSVSLAPFDRPTPVSYRVDVQTENATAELWGYFQVRDESNSPPEPIELPLDLRSEPQTLGSVVSTPSNKDVDLLADLKPDSCFKTGNWTKDGKSLVSSKGYGVRIELPYTPPPEYRLTAIVEPLDQPNGLLFGLKSSDRRFVALVNHTSRRNASTALENVDGRNVGNETTLVAPLLKKDRISQVIALVRKDGVQVMVDGRLVIDWKGSSDQLSLSDYWKTPDDANLFLGTYDCAYRFHRVTVEPL